MSGPAVTALRIEIRPVQRLQNLASPSTPLIGNATNHERTQQMMTMQGVQERHTTTTEEPLGGWIARVQFDHGREGANVTETLPDREMALSWIRSQLRAAVDEAGLLETQMTDDAVSRTAALALASWVSWSLEARSRIDKTPLWEAGGSEAMIADADDAMAITESHDAGGDLLRRMINNDPRSEAPITAALRCLNNGGSVLVHGLDGSCFADVAEAIGRALATIPSRPRSAGEAERYVGWQRARIGRAIASGVPGICVPDLTDQQSNADLIVSSMSSGLSVCCGMSACHAQEAVLRLALAGRPKAPSQDLAAAVEALGRVRIAVLQVEIEDDTEVPRAVRCVWTGSNRASAG